MSFLKDADVSTLARFRAAATARRAYDLRDPEPCDLSIVPRVITPSQAARLRDVAVRVVEASLDWMVDLQAARRAVAGYPLAWIGPAVTRLPAELIGNVRLDFLTVDGRPQLLEMGWVNLSGFDYAPQAAAALLDIVPGLQADCLVERPVAAMRERLLERGVRSLAILVKERHTVYAANDWHLMAEALRPIDTVVIGESEFDSLRATGRGMEAGGRLFDAIYLRSLDGPAAFEGPRGESNRRALETVLASGGVLHDHPLTLLAEDKDLRFLIERDPGLAAVVPQTRSAFEVPQEDAASWVLKLRDHHSGTGVFLDTQAMRARWHDPSAILQERIEPDRFAVHTVHGRRGHAVADLAVHVSYSYDTVRRRLTMAEVAGYFSRFAPADGLTNLCAGGGIVPVLSARSDPAEAGVCHARTDAVVAS